MTKRIKKPRPLTLTEQKAISPYAYTIKDKVFGELNVKVSANAWWVESAKVELLINAFKYRANNTQACVAAGISAKQLEHFITIHPEFCEVMALCKEVLGLKAKQGLSTLLGNNDGTTIRWYLETTEAGEYGKKPPVVAVQINMAERIQKMRERYEE